MLTEAAGLLAATTTAAAKYRIDRAIEDRIEALELAVNLRSWQ